jgi:hypothetical protein
MDTINPKGAIDKIGPMVYNPFKRMIDEGE